MIMMKKRGFRSTPKAISLFATFLLLVVVVIISQPCYASRTFSSGEHVRFVSAASMIKKQQHQNVNNNKNKKIAFLAKKNSSWMEVPRGGSSESTEHADFASSIVEGDDKLSGGALFMFVSALKGLTSYMKGPKADTLLLLFTTALNTPLCRMIGTSPILGYLILGLLFGPNGYNLIKDIHTTEMMADMGIVFFLFEMGIHLDFKTLMSMRRDVFGLGGSQFLVTAAIIAFIGNICGLSMAAQIVIGGGLALSSSAFVLQLLKDKDQMSTTFGRSSFGVLLLQDLAVVPLLVVTPILAGGGGGLAAALGSAGVKAVIALTTIFMAGKFLLKPFFNAVAKTKSQEAFVGAILSTVLGMSFLTEGLGLSNTLGAFLAGVLLSETDHRHHIEKEIAPFRGILVGLFFFSVGFEIDLQLIRSKPGLVAAVVLGIASLKAVIASALSLLFGLSKGTALRVGLILSQGGEFAFVAFRLARSCGILTDDITKLMLTCVSLTMGLTPFLDDFGAKMADALDARPVTNDRKGKVARKKRV
jgi:monovalent cation:proton antiporter-2 (CPA2) family protein